jgi:hypothetical protein
MSSCFCCSRRCSNLELEKPSINRSTILPSGYLT